MSKGVSGHGGNIFFGGKQNRNPELQELRLGLGFGDDEAQTQ